MSGINQLMPNTQAVSNVLVPTASSVAEAKNQQQQIQFDDQVNFSNLSFSMTKMMHNALQSTSDFYHDLSLPDANKVTENAVESPKALEQAADSFANAIVGFVGHKLATEKRYELHSDILSQAKQGLNSGFALAYQETKQYQHESQQIIRYMKQSHQQAQYGIDNLPQYRQRNLVSAASSYQQQVSQMSSLTIRTKEGDTVTLSFNIQQQGQLQNSMQAGYQSTTNRNNLGEHAERSQFGTVQLMSLSQSQTFQVSIDGDLNKEEQMAIADLINTINQLQQQFFDGDIQQAYQKAMEIGFDAGQLSGFTLSLQQSRHIKAANMYQQVEQNNQTLSQQDISTLTKFIEQHKQLQEQSEQLLQEPKQALPKLLESLFNAANDNGSEIKPFMKFFNTFQ